MEFGFVTDELSADPREAIEMGLEWGVTRFEIRNVAGARFPRISPDTLDDLIVLKDEYSILYTAVSPGFFKCRLDDKDAISYALGEGLDLTFDFMEACEVPLLICFGFEMLPGTDAEAVALLRDLAERADEKRVSIAVENETHCKFNTPERIKELLEDIARPNVGANWDLANLKEGASKGYPHGYELVKPFIFNVHVKDVLPTSDGGWQWCPVGKGVCDWRGQLLALKRDDIVEHITIENHCGPPEKVGPENLATIKEYLQEQE